MTVKKFLFLFWGLIFLALSPANATSNRDINRTTVLQLNWKPQFEFAGFIAAKEKGFYKEAGLNVEIRPYRNGMDVVEEVLSGRADFGIYSSRLQRRFLDGEPVQLVASFFKKPTQVLVVDRNITAPSDLVGRKIHVLNRKEFLLNFGPMLRRAGVDPQDLELVVGPDPVKSFLEGKVDATVLYVTSGLYPLDRVGKAYRVIDPVHYEDFVLQQELFSSRKYLEKDPARALAFRNATIRGWEYALAHPEELARIIRMGYGSDKSTEELLYEARLVRKTIQPKLFRIGSFDKAFLRLQFHRLVPDARPKEIDRWIGDYLFGDDTAMSPLILTPRERDYIKMHPTILAHNESYWPPFNFREEGKAQGFAVDYFNLIAERLGVKVDYVAGYTWQQFLSLIHTPKLDVLINAAITPDRKKRLLFTPPYIDLKNAIYTHLDNTPYQSLKELHGKKVALVRGFFIQEYIQKHYPKIKVVLVDNQLEALKLLSLGKVDAAVGKQIVMDYLLRQHLFSGIIATNFVEDPGTISHVALAVDHNDTLLAGILRKAQATLRPAEIQRLRHRWFGINPLLETRELLNKNEKEYLKKKGEIIACIEKDRAPFEFIDAKGTPRGIGIDVLKTLTKKLGVKLSIRPLEGYANIEEMLYDRHCDLLPASQAGAYRSTLLDHTKPYLLYDTVFVVRHTATHPVQGPDLNRAKVGVHWGDSTIDVLASTRPKLHIVYYGDYPELFTSLREGNLDAVLLPRPIFRYYKERGETSGLIVSGTVPVKTELALGVRKDERTLYEIFKKIIHAMPPEMFHAISDKWTQERVVRLVDYRWALEILAAALLIIAGVLLAYWRQRRLMQKIEKLNATLEEQIDEALEKNRQQQLMMLHRNRLANMGEMVAMIAHQWRQPLNNLSLLNQLLITQYRKGRLDEEAIEYFANNSQKQIQQMSQTIDDFRNFYRPDKEKKSFCVQELVRQVVNMVQTTFSNEYIELTVEAQGCDTFRGYPNELAHAILNILNNAKDALIQNIRHDRSISINVRREGEDILITICDNAGGIPEKILPKIFDPYFSTKSDKNGSGLGLYMTSVIITEHMHSKIHAENRDSGACFIIRLQKGEDNGSE